MNLSTDAAANVFPSGTVMVLLLRRQGHLHDIVIDVYRDDRQSLACGM